MIIRFNDKLAVKKYSLICTETLEVDGKIIDEYKSDLAVAMSFDGRYIGYMTLDYLKEQDGDIEEILEDANNIFDDLKYKLTENGNISKLINIPEIKEKWAKLKREKYFTKNIKRNDVKDLIFEITKLLNNDAQLNKTFADYSILPHLFLGIYNRKIDESSPINADRMLWNVFPMEKIPVKYDIYGEETEENKKIVNVRGRHDSNFDRFSYINKVREALPDIGKCLNDDFQLQNAGRIIYSSDDILESFKFAYVISISKKIKYTLIYSLKEKSFVEEGV